MAQGRRSSGSRGDGEAQAAARPVTQRMVLEKVRVIVVPDEITGSGGTPLPADGDALAEQEFVEAWVERGMFEGEKQEHAIRQYAQPDTPEQKPGTYRAVPMSNWRGGKKYKAPPVATLIEESID